MADPGTLAIVSTLVSTGLQVAGGIQANQQAKAQAKQIDLQRQANRTQAAVEENNRQEKLLRLMASQKAIFGASGLSMNSGSFTAIQNTTVGDTANQTGQAELSTTINDNQLLSQKQQTLAGGKAALIGGIAGGVGTIAGAAGSGVFGSLSGSSTGIATTTTGTKLSSINGVKAPASFGAGYVL